MTLCTAVSLDAALLLVAVDEYLRSVAFTTALGAFIDQHCHFFAGSSDGTHTHAQNDVFEVRSSRVYAFAGCVSLTAAVTVHFFKRTNNYF